MFPRKITFDIETKNIFSEVGSNNPADLDISVVCIHDSSDDKYYSFTENEFGQLWPILEKAEILIGYNSDHFDIPLLQKYYPGKLGNIKSVDLLREIKNSIGRRLKMDSVAQATLGRRKTGDGLEAIRWWKNGELDKIKAYCLEDVKITKELYDFAKKNQLLYFPEGGKKKEIKLDTSDWEKTKNNAITHTLPF